MFIRNASQNGIRHEHWMSIWITLNIRCIIRTTPHPLWFQAATALQNQSCVHVRIRLSFTTIPACTPPSGVDHPSVHSEPDLQGDKRNVHIQIQTGVWSCGGSESDRWGCHQIRWIRHFPAECPRPGLNWAKTAAAGSGRSSNVRNKWQTKKPREWKVKGQVPAALPCTPSAVWEEREDPGCFGVLRNSSYPCSAGTTNQEHRPHLSSCRV